ncbi:hypothetical protein [Undibacterium sp.]|uniref:hypothetical protein n=1 Tax=Undibacterium sp. TaxID=1914977 RepID=UPI0025F0AA16|nr:hypothetical protein [Undibacterium sp.]
MKTTTKNRVFALIAVLLIAGIFSALFLDTPMLQIDGEQVGGVLGFGLGMLGLMLGMVTLFFALSLTGLVLVGLAIFLALLVAFILGALALALSPLLLPFLILAGLIMFFSKRKTAKLPA